MLDLMLCLKNPPLYGSVQMDQLTRLFQVTSRIRACLDWKRRIDLIKSERDTANKRKSISPALLCKCTALKIKYSYCACALNTVVQARPQ